MKVLILDNNIMPESWGAKDLCRYKKLAPGAEFYVRRPPQRDFPKNLSTFDKVIISGSKTSVLEEAPWIEDLCALIRKWVASHKPMLGICYGHQALAMALGGKTAVRKSTLPEFGWTKLERIGRSELLDNLPPSFVSFNSHYDEVISLPHGANHTARSSQCDIHGFEIPELRAFGIQFHPEKSLEAGMTYAKHLGANLKYFQHYKDAKKVYDPKVGEIIFKTFLELR